MLASIRIRFTLLYVGILALVLVAFAVLTYFLIGRVLAQETDKSLAEMAQTFISETSSELPGEKEADDDGEEIAEAAGEFRFRDYQFLVLDARGRQIATTITNENLMNRLIELTASEKLQSSYFNLNDADENFRIHQTALDSDANPFQLFVIRSQREQNSVARRVVYVFFVAVSLVLLLSGFGGYFLARRSLAPVAQMSRQAATIGATNLHARLPVKNEKDELGGLAIVFNCLLERLESSFERQRRFMADASHELRTPLSIVRGESEVALSKENRTPGEYRESLTIVQDESKRLTKIVEDLFTLARADAGQFKTNFTEIYLDEMLEDCLRAIRTLAEKRGIELVFSAVEMPIRGDEQLLRRPFINLLDNAIEYNRRGGKVLVNCEKTGELYKVTIADTGTGISSDEQAKIFERFYRVDKARSRMEETSTSGAGLGLSIAQWIAELHQGKIELNFSDESGSTFIVILPLIK